MYLRHILGLIAAVGLSLILTGPASGQAVPSTFPFQGTLTDPGGTPLNGRYKMIFSLYDDTTTAAVWSEEYGTISGGDSISVIDGGFSVLLGAENSLTGIVFDRPFWLGIAVDSDPELTPKTPLVASPYSLGIRVPLVVEHGMSKPDGLVSLTNTGTGAGLIVSGEGTDADGIVIKRAGSAASGSYSFSSSSVGLEVQSAEDYGVAIGNVGLAGIHVKSVGSPTYSYGVGSQNGLDVWGAQGFGLSIGRGDAGGIYISSTGNDGISIQVPEDDAIEIYSPGGEGVNILDAGANAVRIADATNFGVSILNAGIDAIHINNATDDAIEVQDAGDDGIVVQSAGGYSLLVQGQKNSTAQITNHIALIENNASSTSNGPDVLAIKTSATGVNPQTNLISFFDGVNYPLGRIEGNPDSSGIRLASPGGDYAEFLPHLDPGERFLAGDVVGVYGGRISHGTVGADRVMVVSDRSVVVGNTPAAEEEAVYETVAFVGQVPVRVTGSVEIGDYLVASGQEEGTAVAVDPMDLELEHIDRLVGRAWESSTGSSVERVNAEIGLDHTGALARIVTHQQDTIETLRRDLEDVREILDQVFRASVNQASRLSSK